MNEENNYNDAVYSTSWPKTKPINVAEQLEKWNKVRQSLYSQNGWCSENVSQISKWDVGDFDKTGLTPPINMQRNIQRDGYETGTNIWNMNLSHQHGNEPYPPMQDAFFLATHTTTDAAAAAAAVCNATLPINTPLPQQLTHWEHTGAIPKMYNNNNPTNLNCLSVTNAPHFEFPMPGSSSQQIASPANQTPTVFYDCDKMKSQPPTMMTNHADDDVNLALRLQFETMNLEQQNFCTDTTNTNRHAPNLSNPISRNICANPMSNQYQVDCLPQAFL